MFHSDRSSKGQTLLKSHFASNKKDALSETGMRYCFMLYSNHWIRDLCVIFSVKIVSIDPAYAHFPLHDGEKMWWKEQLRGWMGKTVKNRKSKSLNQWKLAITPPFFRRRITDPPTLLVKYWFFYLLHSHFSCLGHFCLCVLGMDVNILDFAASLFGHGEGRAHVDGT